MVDLPTVSREALRQARSESQGGSAYDVPFAKAGLVESIARNMLTASVTGRDPVAYAGAAVQSFDRTGGGPEIRQAIAARSPISADTEIAVSTASAVEGLQRAAENARNEISFGDQAGAAWDLWTGTSAVIDMVQSWEQDFPKDPSFDYMEQREEFEEGLQWGAVQHIRENAKSAEHAAYLRKEQLKYQEQEAILGAHGTGSAILAGLVGGVADPVGWVAGLGVMKGMHLVGVGARASFVAGNTGRGVALTAAEGAAGNVAVEAMLDAAGRRVDVGDYAIAAGFGGAFGIAMSPLTMRGAAKEGAEAQFRQIMQVGEAQNARIYETATANVGPNATSQAINAEVSRLYAAEGQKIADIRMARPDPADRWLGEVDAVRTFREDPATAPGDVLRGAEDQVADSIAKLRTRLEEDQAAIAAAQARNDPDALLRAQEDLAESEALYRQTIADNRQNPLGQQADEVVITDYDREIGVDGMMQTDPLSAKVIAALHASADEWNANNPVDETRLNDLLTRVKQFTPALASTGQQLLRSQHPVARKIVGTLLESTTGASGRRSTAAVDKVMLERIYRGGIEKLPHLYRMYRRSTGGSAVGDWLNQKHYKQFNRELTEFRLAVEAGENLTSFRPEVRAASKMLDNFYNQQRQDMIRVGTPGHEALPKSSDGYFTRRLRAEAIQNLTNPQRRALQAEYKRQLNLLWDDPEFADQVAARIIEHGRIAASGGKEIPSNLYSGSAAPLLRNALKNVGRGKMKLEAPEIEAMVKRITTKGPAFTKSRLDLDIRSSIRDPETGETFSLLDMYETDQMKLATNYARRTSGEVALAKYGIMGEEGLTMLREALTVGRDGQKLTGQNLDDALNAFDQIAAEFLGRPFGQPGQWFRSVDNLRLLVASSRLGGMAFTQMGEYANAIPALGITHTLSAVKSMPRLINEIRTGKQNPLLSSIEQVGGELGTDYKVNFPFQNMDDNFIHGQEQMGAATRLIRSTANAVPFLNGWHYVHAAQVRGMAEQILHKAVKEIRRTDGKPDTQMLTDMGITEQVIANMRKDINRAATFDAKGRMTAFDIEEITDPAVARDFVQSVNRGAKQIIQGTFIGETGKWAHNDLLRLLTQFRTFSIASTEKQWTRVAAIKGGWKTFGYLMGAMSFALPLHLARVQLNSIGRDDRQDYIDEQTSILVLSRALLNYASLSGMASDMLDVGAAGIGAMEGVTGIDTGLEMHGVRGISDGDIGAVIPGIGYLNSTLRGLTSGDPEALIRSLPGGNLPYVVPLLNALKDDGTEDWDLRKF